MSKKKSLGSSPIGFHSENSSLGFIPDLGVAQSTTQTSQSNYTSQSTTYVSQKNSQDEQNETTKTEKKIVSYNLEVDLVSRVKKLADQKGLYYSTLVSNALKNWIAENA